MKKKTVREAIKKKFDEWLSTITDPSVKEQIEKNIIVTGGCIASMLLNEKVNDFDIYFRTKEAAMAVAKYYVTDFKPANASGIGVEVDVIEENNRIKLYIKSAGIMSENGTEKPYEYFESRPEGEASAYVGEVMDDSGAIEEKYEELEEKALADDGKPKYRPVFMSTNAITLSQQVQIVLRFFGEPNEIHENYDFVHCTNYWTSWENKLELNQPALESLLAKELRYVGSRYPVCSVIRLRKFIKRGWTINAGQVLKMMMQISALDLTEVSVLQDQLTGVDCAYFTQVIHLIKEKYPEKLEVAYLIEIIDRMF